MFKNSTKKALDNRFPGTHRRKELFAQKYCGGRDTSKTVAFVAVVVLCFAGTSKAMNDVIKWTETAEKDLISVLNSGKAFSENTMFWNRVTKQL